MSKTFLAIDLGSTNIKAIIAKSDLDNKINILGVGSDTSSGINKGLITNLEDASKSIQNVVRKAKNSTNEHIDSTIVSISGASTKGIRSTGRINIPNGVITEHEIELVLQRACFHATIVPEYEVIHVVPLFFKVDDSNNIENPLNMHGSNLEVSVYIVTAQKTTLINIESALKASNLEVTNFVLSSYANAISVLDAPQKNNGSLIINMGGTTTDFMLYKGNSIFYNDFLPIGSNHITNDLSQMLNTPLKVAEELKERYGSLFKTEENLDIKKVRIPKIGNEDEEEIALNTIQTIIHARVEEILILTKEAMIKSGTYDKTGSGIVITGGMANLIGIKELASRVFDSTPTKVANPLNIKNGYINFDDPTMSSIVGLLLYVFNQNRNFELDSNRKLRKKTFEPRLEPQYPSPQNSRKAPKGPTPRNRENTILPKVSKSNKKGFWNSFAELF